jgi:hypothetical protein
MKYRRNLSLDSFFPRGFCFALISNASNLRSTGLSTLDNGTIIKGTPKYNRNKSRILPYSIVKYNYLKAVILSYSLIN